MDMSLSKIMEMVKKWKPGTPRPMRSQRVRHDLATEHSIMLYNTILFRIKATCSSLAFKRGYPSG